MKLTQMLAINIQSWSDIITNSSTEIFCVSNGNQDKLQELIDTILDTFGIKANDIFRVIEKINVESIDWMSTYVREEFDEYICDTCGIEKDEIESFIEENCDNPNFVNFCKEFNFKSEYGKIFTTYSIRILQDHPNIPKIKGMIETLENLFNYGEYNY